MLEGQGNRKKKGRRELRRAKGREKKMWPSEVKSVLIGKKGRVNEEARGGGVLRSSLTELVATEEESR